MRDWTLSKIVWVAEVGRPGADGGNRDDRAGSVPGDGAGDRSVPQDV
jgi:hypothetical protein